ncbi:26S proteasome regulatory subunit 6B [Ancistrocladus abbreviatus]
MAASAIVWDPKLSSEPPASIPSIRMDPQGLSDHTSSYDDDDLYGRLKSLERQLEFIDIQEEYVKDEQKNLKRELLRAQEEVKRIQSVPLVIGQFMEMVDQNNGIVGSTTGSNYYVRILSTINRELLKPSASVALHRHSNALVDVLPPEADSSISLLSQSEKPDVTYNDIGGCDIQKQEIREAVELPLTHHELYKQIGIDPPRGVLLYGPPGTGKTMLAKAVAHHTTAAFIRVVGSEFVQKYLGEGPRMVRDVFRLAKENAPAIIFIDEVDAIATARFDAQTGADREVQRILMELLNQMDGFDQTVNVKVIMATNRADTLDPALIRPGRLDRKIEFPLPDRRQKRLVFQVCTSKMNLSDEVDLEDYVSRPDKISAAEIAAICQEAGMHAVRKNRYVILPKDFEKGYRSNVKKPDTEFDFYKELLKLASLSKSPAEPSAGANAPDILFGGKIEISNFAVDTFNKNFHSLDGVSGPLEFEAVLAAEKQVVNGMEIEGGNKDVQDLGKFSVEEYNKKFHSLNEVSSGKLTFEAVVAEEKQDVQDLGKFSMEEYNKKFHSLNGASSGKLTFEVVVATEKQVIAGLKSPTWQFQCFVGLLKFGSEGEKKELGNLFWNSDQTLSAVFPQVSRFTFTKIFQDLTRA